MNCLRLAICEIVHLENLAFYTVSIFGTFQSTHPFSTEYMYLILLIAHSLPRSHYPPTLLLLTRAPSQMQVNCHSSSHESKTEPPILHLLYIYTNVQSFPTSPPPLSLFPLLFLLPSFEFHATSTVIDVTDCHALTQMSQTDSPPTSNLPTAPPTTSPYEYIRLSLISLSPTPFCCLGHTYTQIPVHKFHY